MTAGDTDIITRHSAPNQKHKSGPKGRLGLSSKQSGTKKFNGIMNTCRLTQRRNQSDERPVSGCLSQVFIRKGAAELQGRKETNTQKHTLQIYPSWKQRRGSGL